MLSDDSLRWAIIGTGRISTSIVQDLQAIGGQIAAVHSRVPENAESFAGTFAIPTWSTDLDAILNRADVDVVYIATPFVTHHSIATAALQAGKHVVVEKPMATSAAEVADLFSTAHAEQRFLMEAMWMKFSPLLQRIHAEVAAGTIGIVRHVSATFGMPLPRDGGSRWDPTRSPGVVLDQGIYPVTLAHEFLGVPTEIGARGYRQADGIELSAAFTLGYGDGMRANGHVSMAEFLDQSAAIGGTTGWLAIPPLFWTSSEFAIHAGSWDRMVKNPEHVSVTREGLGYTPMLRAVEESITAGELQSTTHPAHETVAAFRTLDAIREAIS